MNIVIIGSSVISDYEYISRYIHENDFIICADGGLLHAENLSVIPDMIVGDMDSVDNVLLSKYRQKNIEIKKFPKDKDKTDTEISIDIAISMEPEKITFLGVTEGRVDHFLSVLYLTERIASSGIKSLIADKENEIYTIKDSIRIKKGNKSFLSLIPTGLKTKGVTVKGTKYPLENETIYRDSSLTVSNEISAEYAEITVGDSGLFVILS